MRFLFLLIAVAGALIPLSGQSYEHVIVTADSFVSSFAPLGQYIASELGLSDTTVTVEYIYSHSPGRDNPERIRNFIRYAYANWGTTHVLLGGDDDILPCRKGWVDASHIVEPLKDTIPTDLYFSDLDGDWDRDGDGLFGETEDSVDLYPDVHVARMPASRAGTVSLLVDKFLTYCADSSAAYLRNVLLAGFDIAHDPEAIGEVTLELYDSAYVSPGMKPCTKVYDSHPGNHRSAVLAALNAGQHIYIQWDHGNTNAYGCGWLNHNWTIGNGDVYALTNGPRYSIFVAAGCLTGHFDGMDCILENALCAPNGGAVAGTGNSRCGVMDGRTPQRKYTAFMIEGFVRALFSHAGPADLTDFTTNRARAAPLADTNLIYRWSDYCMNLMGEPAMPVWVPGATGVAEPARPAGQVVDRAWPSHVLGSLVLRGKEPLIMTDALGRNIMRLEPGTNSLERVPAGVYFLRTAGHSGRFMGRIVKVSEE